MKGENKMKNGFLKSFSDSKNVKYSSINVAFCALIIAIVIILNAIIGAPVPETVPVFADGSSVPAWAKGSIYALTNAGVFKGTGSGKFSPNDVLSRAQTAQILLTVKKLYS